ncbi:hypothetical protein G7Z17_g2631 [Cylindrodendrum hubeiense]|uniref:NmrA-like domain-containing protein n=1 Tax=Cylindrodendrum hubeiense TaxID=595255 RepID=A0A9P5HIH2_9HYPO|nr:hypothetical protein G7Z17_g2631 [Cylindrodendrum hubeiense]
MVKIAVAGGSGGDSIPGVTWRAVAYDDKSDLVDALKGTHTVLSFIQVMKDTGNQSQKSLIDAAIIAGVKRFAPSEWGSAGTAGMPWWTGKGEVKEYLEKVNENGKVLGYTLFQPGLFLDYLATPYKTARYVTPLNTMIDFQNRRAIIIDGHDSILTFTTVQDLATVVAKAVEYEGEWPVTGGICGNKVTVSQILEIGRPFAIDNVKLEDLEAGNLKSSWTLETAHPSLTKEQAESMMKTVLIGTLLSSAKGAWATSDEFNQLLPEHKFAQIEEFLAEVWVGKP